MNISTMLYNTAVRSIFDYYGKTDDAHIERTLQDRYGGSNTIAIDDVLLDEVESHYTKPPCIVVITDGTVSNMIGAEYILARTKNERCKVILITDIKNQSLIDYLNKSEYATDRKQPLQIVNIADSVFRKFAKSYCTKYNVMTICLRPYTDVASSFQTLFSESAFTAISGEYTDKAPYYVFTKTKSSSPAYRVNALQEKHGTTTPLSFSLSRIYNLTDKAIAKDYIWQYGSHNCTALITAIKFMQDVGYPIGYPIK